MNPRLNEAPAPNHGPRFPLGSRGGEHDFCAPSRGRWMAVDEHEQFASHSTGFSEPDYAKPSMEHQDVICNECMTRLTEMHNYAHPMDVPIAALLNIAHPWRRQ
jgi:hypothetical protein